jgi:hypothetical protein
MLGIEGSETDLKISVDRDDFDLSKLTEPKEGQFDPTGAPHHGGGNFMGGTGKHSTLM